MADSELERIMNLIRKTPANHEYFFDNLDDPGWLPLLAEQGFFRKPIEPERGDGWIRYCDRYHEAQRRMDGRLPPSRCVLQPRLPGS